MEEKKFTDMEDLMLDYGEMTSFDFNSMDYKEVRELQRITDSGRPMPSFLDSSRMIRATSPRLM